MKTLSKALIFVSAVLIVFTIVMIIVFCIKDSVPDTLITCVFAACTSEIGGCTWIKLSKIKKGDTYEGEDVEEIDE